MGPPLASFSILLAMRTRYWPSVPSSEEVSGWDMRLSSLVEAGKSDVEMRLGFGR